MNDELNNYKIWNSALWRYFFPTGQDNPVLYIDEGVLSQIASDAGLVLSPGIDSWSDYLLKTTLIKDDSFKYFLNQLRAVPELSYFSTNIRTWEQLVEHLKGKKLKKQPAYFAMLCSIFLVATKCGADHAKMRNGAKVYLGENYRSRFGELVDPLLQQLHEDIHSFDQNRMICGRQRNMSRLKFHLVLPRAEREDFIDFIEVNNLKWDRDEITFPFFVNSVLVPALDSAKKNGLSTKVTRQENIPYFKSILLSDHQYGKTESEYRNTIQKKVFRWRFRLFFEYDGNYHFYISSDMPMPFGVCLDNDQFVKTDCPFLSENVAVDIPLKAYKTTEFSLNGEVYVFSNVSSSQKEFGSVFYFEQISPEAYTQVDVPETGGHYYAFVKNGTTKIPSSWFLVPGDDINGYCLYEIPSFSGRGFRAEKNRVRLEDSFCRQNLGSWYSIKLDDSNSIYWLPNEVGSKPIRITEGFRNKDGFTFFHIPVNDQNLISGTIMVKSGDQEILSDPVSAQFKWRGDLSRFHLNGWGEITPGEQPLQDFVHPPLRKSLVQNQFLPSDAAPPILLQLIHDLADESGCVTRRRLIAAIEFSLSYYGIKSAPEYCRNLIYCLRRLGYVIKYETDNQEVSYQLIAPFLEKTNYSLTTISRAVLVKGVYSQEQITNLLNSTNVRSTCRIRPYSQQTLTSHPEYVCLPDQILIEASGSLPLKTLDHPIADQFLNSMESINGFCDKFGITKSGDIYRGVLPPKIPGMIKGPMENEALCTRQNNGELLIHSYYTRDGVNYSIPKHLARLYAQVQRGDPICLMNCNGNDVDYMQISFVSKMGVPGLLDIALCDLSLVMPSYETVFILYQDSLGLSNSKPWTERRTYDTHSISDDHSYMLSWLSKLAGKNVIDIKKERTSVFITGRARGFRLMLKKDFLHHKDLLALYKGNDLLAFSIGKDVYLFDNESRSFQCLIGKDINLLLSDIISDKKKDLMFSGASTIKTDSIKSAEGIEIPILKRINL